MAAGARYASTPLLTGANLEGFPGSPFNAAVMEAVAAGIRDAVGWHIAPSVTETLTVRSSGGRNLYLPTAYLTALSEIRDVTDPSNPVVVDGWDSAPDDLFRAGVIRRRIGWPCGASLAVDVVHGYPMCPPDLLPLIAARCQQAAMPKFGGTVQLGSLSISGGGGYASSDGAVLGAVLSDYEIAVI